MHVRVHIQCLGLLMYSAFVGGRGVNLVNLVDNMSTIYVILNLTIQSISVLMKVKGFKLGDF